MKVKLSWGPRNKNQPEDTSSPADFLCFILLLLRFFAAALKL